MKLNFKNVLFNLTIAICILGQASLVKAEEGFDLNSLTDESKPAKENISKKEIPINLDTQNTSFTEFAQQNEQNVEGNEKMSSWLGGLTENVSQAITTQNKPEVLKRSNASVFDISGIMLRMTSKQAEEAMKRRGYQKTSEKLDIPNFIRWRFEESCRNQGVIGFERIGSCVVQMAKKNNYQYVQQMSFNNFRTKETVDVFLTSNFTGNKVYRIMYQTEAANIKGSGAKADYLRNIKIYDFWKKINQKYGEPDNKEQVTWGLGENKPMMQASTGKLTLADPMLLELDYTRMSREDQKFMNTAVYTF